MAGRKQEIGMWAAAKKEEKAAREDPREALYLLGRAGSWPRKSGPVRHHRKKQGIQRLHHQSYHTIKARGQ